LGELTIVKFDFKLGEAFASPSVYGGFMNKLFLILILPLSAGVLSACSSSHGSSASVESAAAAPVPNAPSSSSLSQSDAKNMAQYFGDSAASDISNSAAQQAGLSQGGSGVVFPNMKVGGISPIAPCITIHDVAVGDVIFKYACNPVGTVEIKTSSDDTGSVSVAFDNKIEEIISLQSMGIVVGSYSYSTNSDLNIDQKMERSLAQAAGVGKISGGLELLSLSAAKKFDDKYTFSSDSGEVKGQSSYQYTPDNVSSASSGGAVVISSTFSLLKNSADVDDFTVSSSALHRSSCGFDKGSIEFKDATDDYVMIFTACGQHTLTDNGNAL